MNFGKRIVLLLAFAGICTSGAVHPSKEVLEKIKQAEATRKVSFITSGISGAVCAGSLGLLWYFHRRGKNLQEQLEAIQESGDEALLEELKNKTWWNRFGKYTAVGVAALSGCCAGLSLFNGLRQPVLASQYEFYEIMGINAAMTREKDRNHKEVVDLGDGYVVYRWNLNDNNGEEGHLVLVWAKDEKRAVVFSAHDYDNQRQNSREEEISDVFDIYKYVRLGDNEKLFGWRKEGDFLESIREKARERNLALGGANGPGSSREEVTEAQVLRAVSGIDRIFEDACDPDEEAEGEEE